VRRLFALFIVSLAVACGEDPPPAPSGNDAGDASVIDVGFFEEDSGVVPDSGVVRDSGVPDDSGVTPDTGTADDAGPGPDAEVDAGPDASVDAGLDAGVDAAVDAGVDGGVDAGPVDTGVVDAGPPDSGVLTDGDNDGIADLHEGNGAVDSDGDGTPDSQDADSDADGIPDAVEAGDADVNTPPVDSDHDGVPDFRDTDADGDLIDDLVEGTADPDGDTIPSYLDDDSDADFISDRAEGAADPDGDNVPSFLDADSDGDGLSDALEAGDQLISSPPLDSDFDGVPNFLDADSDNDFIRDVEEGNRDSDGDTILDYIDIDSDNDSILDRVEAGDQDLLTPALDTDNDTVPNYRDADSDADTLSDLQEGRLDTDNDGIEDRLELDADGDGWSDALEAGDVDLLTPPVDTDADAIPDFRDLDSDGDGLRDALEPGCPSGSNRLSADSDNDGFDDLAESAFGSNPCNASQGISDFYFVLPPNGPVQNAPLSFSDTQIDRADLAINVDTTGSMGGEIANLRASLSSSIIPQVDQAIPDAAFAVSSFEDYPILPYGQPTASDRPFRLHTRVTTNAASAQTAVNALTIRNGFDYPESGLESLYQVSTGMGTSWTGGSVAAFNPNAGRVPGVADGDIGGVGFRDDSLPVVVHITDAVSHTTYDYSQSASTINAATVPQVRQALANVGARVVTITSGAVVPFNDQLCTGNVSTFFGGITPVGDVDWFLIQGAVAGDSVTVDVTGAVNSGSLDPMVAVANSTTLLAIHDDIDPANFNRNSRIQNLTLTGTGPFYIAVSSTGDPNFDGAGGTTAGFYMVDFSINGGAQYPTPTTCRAEDANNRTGATVLVPAAQAQAPASQAQCQAECDQYIGVLHPLFADFTFPYEISEDTGAVIPPCAWSFFGSGRPAGCGVNQCCTGINGAGVPTNGAGNYPLSYEIDPNGSGLGNALVAGVQALVNFSVFTITTVVRPDPVQLGLGLDTSCFIHGVVPVNAIPPNVCAPTPVPVDLVPPSPELDSWQNVVPGTVLEFQVNAVNQQQGTGTPCAPSITTPQQFTAYIDVVADGVTVVDTRQVIIIVPPTATGGSN
jgi:hypothetical protein